jgi:hypothetical protein
LPGWPERRWPRSNKNPVQMPRQGDQRTNTDTGQEPTPSSPSPSAGEPLSASWRESTRWKWSIILACINSLIACCFRLPVCARHLARLRRGPGGRRQGDSLGRPARSRGAGIGPKAGINGGNSACRWQQCQHFSASARIVWRSVGPPCVIWRARRSLALCVVWLWITWDV